MLTLYLVIFPRDFKTQQKLKQSEKIHLLLELEHAPMMLVLRCEVAVGENWKQSFQCPGILRKPNMVNIIQSLCFHEAVCVNKHLAVLCCLLILEENVVVVVLIATPQHL